MLLRRVGLQVLTRWLTLMTFGEAEGSRGKGMLAQKREEDAVRSRQWYRWLSRCKRC